MKTHIKQMKVLVETAVVAHDVLVSDEARYREVM